MTMAFYSSLDFHSPIHNRNELESNVCLLRRDKLNRKGKGRNKIKSVRREVKACSNKIH
jgi:hypothetical protein